MVIRPVWNRESGRCRTILRMPALLRKLLIINTFTLTSQCHILDFLNPCFHASTIAAAAQKSGRWVWATPAIRCSRPYWHIFFRFHISSDVINSCRYIAFARRFPAGLNDRQIPLIRGRLPRPAPSALCFQWSEPEHSPSASG